MIKKIMTIVLLFILGMNLSIVNAVETLPFVSIPESITNTEALMALKYAATKRKWAVEAAEMNTLRISLNHRGYKALLHPVTGLII